MTRLVVIFGFLLAFVAGYMLGVYRPQYVAIAPTAGPTTRESRGPGELDKLLDLRAEQKEQLKQIWSEMAERGRKHHEERRRDLRRQRDEKIEALLAPEQKSRMEQVQQEYDEQTKALEREMRANFQKAVEATRAVLDPDQRVRYDQWLEKRQWGRGPRGGDRDRERNHETTRRSDVGATSRPSDQP